MKKATGIAVMLILTGGIMILYTGYVSRPHNSPLRTVTVSTAPTSISQYYAGTIQPVRLSSVVNPADGIIDGIFFEYGHPVRRNTLLFTVNSEKFYEGYKTALMQYIRAKSEFIARKTQFDQSRILHATQLISEDEYKAKKKDSDNAQLEMIQTKLALEKIRRQSDLQMTKIYDLNAADIDKITHILQSRKSLKHLKVFSPRAGVVLQPSGRDSATGGLKVVQPGDPAKSGDVLAIIADPDHFVIDINVSEFDINRIKTGQKASITGAAFAGMVLRGKVIWLNYQGESGVNGIPTFPVRVSIQKLTPAEKSIIRAGMNAKVEIAVGETGTVSIPFAAVLNGKDGFYVRVLDDRTGKIHNVSVIPDRTILDSVIVKSSLTNGDKVVVPG